MAEGEDCRYHFITCNLSHKRTLSLICNDLTLVFRFQHPDFLSCDLPGNCGFLLKTIPNTDKGKAWNFQLCTKSEEYRDQPVHFHKEVQAEKMNIFCFKHLPIGKLFVGGVGIVKKMLDLEIFDNTLANYYGSFGILYEI